MIQHWLSEQLVKAIKSADIVRSSELIKWGADINALDRDGDTLLQIAAQNDNLSVINFLVENHINVFAEVKNEKKLNALHISAYHGHAKNVEYFVKLGFDVNEVTKHGETALHLAAMNGHLDCVQSLLKHQANIECEDHGKSRPLHAAIYGTIDCLQYLVQQKVNLSAKNDCGSTALHLAVYAGKFEAVKYLINKGSDVFTVDNNNKNVIDIAKEYNRSVIYDFLMSYRENQVLSKSINENNDFNLIYF